MIKSALLILATVGFSAASFAASTKPLNSVWTAQHGGEVTGITEYDMSAVHFSKDGDYTIQVKTIFEEEMPAVVHIDNSKKNRCFTVDVEGLSNYDTQFCPFRRKNTLKWFSNLAFNQTIGAEPYNMAVKNAYIIYK